MIDPVAHRKSSIRSEAVMGTLITIQVLRNPDDEAAGAEKAIERAFGWFHEMEQRCSRFDDRSELRKLAAHPGEAVEASPLLFEALRFALLVAEETDGAFDPTVGHRMAERGFNRDHRTGYASAPLPYSAANASYRDVELDPDRRTITLRQPVLLDLGAVAKGLAVDTAAQELKPFENFAIDAGGDLYMSGTNCEGEAWKVGIRHPRCEGELIDSLRISNQAVCTSGDYERGQHIIDPRTGHISSSVASVTVVAPGAMLADAFATAAFVLGPAEGILFLDRMGVSGLIVTPELERYETRSLPHAA